MTGAGWTFCGSSCLKGLLANGLVEDLFVGRKIDMQNYIGARRQFFEHLTLEAAQDKGLDQFAQSFAGVLIAKPLNGAGKALVKGFKRAQQSGIDESEQVPQFAEMVFNRGTGGEQPETGLKFH